MTDTPQENKADEIQEILCIAICGKTFIEGNCNCSRLGQARQELAMVIRTYYMETIFEDDDQETAALKIAELIEGNQIADLFSGTGTGNGVAVNNELDRFVGYIKSRIGGGEILSACDIDRLYTEFKEVGK